VPAGAPITARTAPTLGFDAPQDAGDAARRRAQTIRAPDDYPYLAEIATRLSQTGYDPAVEFALGLDLILDSLDRLLRTNWPRRQAPCGGTSTSHGRSRSRDLDEPRSIAFQTMDKAAASTRSRRAADV
jgi:hypothetical protein